MMSFLCTSSGKLALKKTLSLQNADSQFGFLVATCAVRLMKAKQLLRIQLLGPQRRADAPLT